MLVRRGDWGLGLEGQSAGEELVVHDAHGIEIAASISTSISDDLGCDVIAAMGDHSDDRQPDIQPHIQGKDAGAALANVLEALASRPEERKRLGEAARKSVVTLVDTDRTEARLTELIKKACGKA